jgi:exodeoxyribonuclease V alpha subunit
VSSSSDPGPAPRGDASEAPAEAGGAWEGDALQGTIDVVTYHQPDNLYTVLRLVPEAGSGDPQSPVLFPGSRLTAVGPLPEPVVGMRVRLFGSWVTHRKHGRQFEFEEVEQLAPADAEGLARYLSSKAFAGIGETLARRIVAKLGARALEAIREDPSALEGIPGLKRQRREELVASVRQEFALHQLHAFLRGAGLGPAQAAAVVRTFGADCEARLRQDPYLIAGRVKGIGFAIADRFAAHLGVARDGPERCRAGILHALETAASDGHSFSTRTRLFGETRALLQASFSSELLERALLELEQAGELVLESFVEVPALSALREAGPLVYLPWLAASERGLAQSLAQLLGSSAPGRANPGPLATPAQLAEAEARSGLSLHPLQRDAVLGLLSHPVGLLTGGPGVGKTTLVSLIVHLAEGAGARVLLASPTGRAAKRLAEATGRNASTIHRMLGWNPQLGAFHHDAQRPLEADLIVVDEISMLDVVLAHQLFKAVRAPTRVALVGDPDQLPSVGPGNVLQDLLRSRSLPVFRLTQIFRQQDQSLIVVNAHRILEGELPLLPQRGDLEAEFYFFPAEDPLQCAERVVEVVTQRIPQRFGLDWMEDVQVLAPMYRGECGVDALNERLREALGQGGQAGGELFSNGRTWRVGDRVIQTRNDYDKDVFNGDMGRIASVDDEGGLAVRYPEQVVAYSRNELSDLQPAFAITVHRAQGSEYPAVVIPLVPQHFMMLQRNLLYTAVTRARRLVVLVGSRRALQMALENTEQSLRASALAERLNLLVARP